jgi:superfamily I DNA/RNA helicase
MCTSNPLSNVAALSNGVEGINFIPNGYGEAGFPWNANGGFPFQVGAHLALLQSMNRDQLEQWRHLYFGNDATINHQIAIQPDHYFHLNCAWWEACGGDREDPPNYKDLLLGQLPTRLPVADPPTDLQLQVIHSPLDSKLLILAPPGTGKTHTVVQRLLRIAANRGGDLENVLVVSFSRAAASELHLRVSGEMARMRFLGNRPDIRTLDSLAGMGVQGQANYEATIREFRNALAREDHPQHIESYVQARLPLIEHLIVDEIQDTTGERAELVLSLARRLARTNQAQGRPFSLLLLGDLRQSIHDFMLGGGSRNSFWMVRRFRESFPTMERISFTREYRFEGNPDMQKITKNLREAMDSSGVNEGGQEEGERPDPVRLGQVLGQLQEIPTLESLVQKAVQAKLSGKSMAILTRSNQGVRLLESQLHGDAQANAIRLRTVFSNQGAGYPGWVAMLLQDHPIQVEDTPENRRNFANLFAQRLRIVGIQAESLPTANQAFDWLRAAFNFRHEVGHDDLVELMKGGQDEPNELRPPVNPGEIWISVVHQAKGREYDRVVLAGDKLVSPPGFGDRWQEKCRVSYVAATRAKENLFKLAWIQHGGFDWSKKNSAISAWIPTPAWATYDMNALWSLWLAKEPLLLQWNPMRGVMCFVHQGTQLDMEPNASQELCDHLGQIRNNYQATNWKVRILDLRTRLRPGGSLYLTPVLSADILPQG